MQAYARDLDRFANWCGSGALRTTPPPRSRNWGHLSYLHDEEAAPPGVARHLVAAQDVLPLPADGGARGCRAVDLLGSPKLWEPSPGLAPPRWRNCSRRARGRRPVLPPGPCPARNALRHRLPGVGGGGAQARGHVPRLRLLPLLRKGEQTARPAGPAGDCGDPGLSGRSERSEVRGQRSEVRCKWETTGID